MRNTKKGAAQVKFDTTAHDYGRRAAKMTPKERSDYREGQKIAVSFAPVGGLVAKITSKILTSMPKIAKIVKAGGGGSRPLIINNKIVKSYTPKKGTNPGSKPGRPPHEIYHTTKPKPRTKFDFMRDDLYNKTDFSVKGAYDEYASKVAKINFKEAWPKGK